MQTNTTLKPKSQPAQTMPLRAIVEILGGELKVYPIADSDADEKIILDVLRFVREQAA
jgi:hypothetical protein